MQNRELRNFRFLNKDDRPEDLSPEEIVDSLNMRMGSSQDEQEMGLATTLQSEIEVDLTGTALYYGSAIGGEFLYSGFSEIRIGGQVWMRRNLDINYPGSKVYNNDEANRAIYGGLYTWEQLNEIDPVTGKSALIPDGWHLPTEAEFNQLLSPASSNSFPDTVYQEYTDGVTSVRYGIRGGYLYYDITLTATGFAGDEDTDWEWFKAEQLPVPPGALPDYYEEIAGGALKEVGTEHWNAPNEGGTDLLGFKALPGGSFDAVFGLIGTKGKFWLQDEVAVALPVIGNLVDKDGNIYTTVDIGTQRWIIENLKTTKYADGSAIPNLLDVDDWYSGSKDDVNKMRDELYLHSVGGFSGGWYWSSSQVYDHDVSFILAWAQQFLDGVQYETVKVYNEGFTRPIRSFISTTVYALRDVGPVGGWIFSVIDLGGGSYSYLEAAPSDIEDLAWSNVIDSEVVGTSTAIGTGRANTTAIITQAGHLTSAAKICDDLVNIGGWTSDTIGAYCWYNNNIVYKTPYGALYNWYAVNNAHGLAYFEKLGVQEAGWRVPSDADWDTLIAFLGGGAVAGGKLKEMGLAHWDTPNTGATDEVGFKAVGAGYRSQIGAFYDIKIHSDWFSSSSAKLYTIENFDIDFYSYNSNSNMGFSIRCVKDI